MPIHVAGYAPNLERETRNVLMASDSSMSSSGGTTLVTISTQSTSKLALLQPKPDACEDPFTPQHNASCHTACSQALRCRKLPSGGWDEVGYGRCGWQHGGVADVCVVLVA